MKTTTKKTYKLTFGKHAGKTLEEVFQSDKQYFSWLEKNITTKAFEKALEEYYKDLVIEEKKVEEFSSVEEFIFANGKYKGKTIKTLETEDFKYLIYLNKTSFEGEAKRAITIYFENIYTSSSFCSEYMTDSEETSSYTKEEGILIYSEKKYSDGFYDYTDYYKRTRTTKIERAEDILPF